MMGTENMEQLHLSGVGPSDSVMKAQGLEEITITSPIYIQPGEGQVYHDQIVHVQADIHCEGMLIFQSCVIHYNEPGTAGRITMEENSRLTVANSVIQCHGYRKEMFLDMESELYDSEMNPLRFDDCAFIHCGNFFDTEGAELAVKNCLFRGCWENVIGSRQEQMLNTIMENCEIDLGQTPDFLTGIEARGPLFHAEQFRMTNCLVVGPYERGGPRSGALVCVFGRGLAKRCTFVGLNHLFSCLGDYFDARSCLFVRCTDVFNDGMLAGAYSCRFDECTALSGSQRIIGKMVDCQFNDCYEELWKFGEISFFFDCQFNNWVGGDGEATAAMGPGAEARAMLHFHQEEKKEAVISAIKNCTFRGMEAGNYFVVAASCGGKPGKPVLEMGNCDFEACRSTRQDGALLKTHETYPGLLKAKNVEMISLSHCVGLSGVNRGSGCVDDVRPMTQDAQGEPIGAALRE
jgi:hypothetical protein